MKYITHARVTAPFRGYSEAVARSVGHQHTGLDQWKGFGKPWIADSEGIAYKVHQPDANFTWSGVHMLVKDGDEYVEYIPIGHANAVSVREGDFVSKGQIVGYEGNHGLVYSGGRRVTVEERKNKSKKGAHNHTGTRPVIPVSEMREGKHYLRNRDGSAYQLDGQYMEIKYTNDTKGWVDPLTYYPEKASDRIELMMLNAAAEGNTTKVLTFFLVLEMVRAFSS